ncbi:MULTISPECIES: glycosyltransferase [Streptomyces]|uniref:D-inositol 3-phosphate glycosyltransferase n=1 Tax=Streptomyces microflavus TaxID=1919 RepID=A0A6N9V5U3_STRMI|nr:MULTISPECIES: glycosyltransferase [Streptomyces]MBW3361887.1 glycosyltransferase [Streptomyces sp. 09ZI22]NEB68200.1 glycosyltransferase family 4 protein [Streptomyces microflavus]
MKIEFLVQNAYSSDGSTRAVLNLAAALADTHEVRVVSVFRWLDRPAIAPAHGVRVVSLLDLREGRRPDKQDVRRLTPTRVIPRTQEMSWRYSQLTDDKIEEYLQASQAQVLVGTSLELAAYVSRWGRPRALRVGQLHQLSTVLPAAEQSRAWAGLGRLDAVVVPSVEEARAVNAAGLAGGVAVYAHPDCVPDPRIAPADGRSRVVMAAGRLVPEKRFDLLVQAFAQVVRARPDWQLRIYGTGPEYGQLRALVAELDLYNHVFLMMEEPRLEARWAAAAIAAGTSDRESFGLALAEAMRCGLPVVATACPGGPGEIVRHEVNGLLTPVDDADAFAAALLRLIEDEPTRTALGARAREDARAYGPELSAGRFEQVIRMARRTRRESRPAAEVAVSCAVAPDGLITLLLDGVRGGRDDLQLVLRRRKARRGERPVRLPLVPSEEGVPHRYGTVVPPDPGVLTEGRWDIHLDTGEGKPAKVRPGSIDLRGFGPVSTGPAYTVVQLPYASESGHLALRTWTRDRHAEATEVWADDGIMHVRGLLYGSDFGAAEPLLLMRRRGMEESGFWLPGVSSGGADFSFSLPASDLSDQLVSRHELWDLWVGRRHDPVVARLGRFLTDVVDVKSVFAYPTLVVPTDDGPPVMVKPYYTAGTELSVRVSEKAE